VVPRELLDLGVEQLECAWALLRYTKIQRISKEAPLLRSCPSKKHHTEPV